MKKLVYLIVFSLSFLSFGQNVTLNKVVKTHTNSDKVLYKINPILTPKTYLGEIEIQGFSCDDAKIFGMIYSKAKEIGANAFSWEPFVQIDDSVVPFDPTHYKLNLYYVESKDFPEENNVVYLIAPSYQTKKIAINNNVVEMKPRTYSVLHLEGGEIYTVSTRKLFGSTIKMSAQKDQPVQFFQISGFSVNSNNGPGLNIKSGDIIKLEKSYGQFLTTIYQLIKN